ncbi:uncharacterized [Tachysurus ichikawai]
MTDRETLALREDFRMKIYDEKFVTISTGKLASLPEDIMLISFIAVASVRPYIRPRTRDVSSPSLFK